MEDVFGRLGEILKPQFDLLNEAERNGDDIIVKKIGDDILVKAIKEEIQQTKTDTNE